MTRMIKIPDIIFALAPSAASFSLASINEIAACTAAVLGVVYLALGCALRLLRWKREVPPPSLSRHAKDDS